MKKTAGLCPAILIMALSLSGCGGVSMDVGTNTLYVGSNGKITEVIVEDFGEDYYDEDELKSYIDDAVASYQEENGKSGIEVKKYEVKNGVARLLMEYDGYDSYASFNEAKLYTGTLLQAQADGYDFDVNFKTPDESAETGTEAATVPEEEAATENVIQGQIIEENTETAWEPASETVSGISADEVLSEEDRKVLILEQDTDVKVKGEILYVSDHVKVTGKDTATVYGEGSDSADTGLAYIIYK